MLSLLASRSAGIFNLSDISRGLGIPHTTTTRYMALLEALFLVFRIPPWFANRWKRLVKSPKMHLCDTGLAAYLLGMSTQSLKTDRLAFGRLLETFIAAELKYGDFSGLVSLKETAGSRFTAGYIVYTGEKRLPFGLDFWPVPVQELWR